MYYTLYIWYKYQLEYKKAHAVYTSNSEITYLVYGIFMFHTLL